jgi:hypothetical protein
MQNAFGESQYLAGFGSLNDGYGMHGPSLVRRIGRVGWGEVLRQLYSFRHRSSTSPQHRCQLHLLETALREIHQAPIRKDPTYEDAEAHYFVVGNKAAKHFAAVRQVRLRLTAAIASLRGPFSRLDLKLEEWKCEDGRWFFDHMPLPRVVFVSCAFPDRLEELARLLPNIHSRRAEMFRAIMDHSATHDVSQPLQWLDEVDSSLAKLDKVLRLFNRHCYELRLLRPEFEAAKKLLDREYAAISAQLAWLDDAGKIALVKLARLARDKSHPEFGTEFSWLQESRRH